MVGGGWKACSVRRRRRQTPFSLRLFERRRQTTGKGNRAIKQDSLPREWRGDPVQGFEWLAAATQAQEPATRERVLPVHTRETSLPRLQRVGSDGREGEGASWDGLPRKVKIR